jgi:hypothetical protein
MAKGVCNIAVEMSLDKSSIWAELSDRFGPPKDPMNSVYPTLKLISMNYRSKSHWELQILQVYVWVISKWKKGPRAFPHQRVG